ncbi:MAG: beta strand repeat-containing protein, partial [Planctomycetia bacterium]
MPGANDTAVFNTSGSNAAGTALFTGDASVRGLLVLQTATGGLTLSSTGGDRTLTLGAGGIRVQPGNTSALTLGNATAGQRLNVTLGASQEWRMAGGNVTISNTVSGAAASRPSPTLRIANAAAVTTKRANGAGGGTLNLWLNHSGNVTLTNPSALTGTLTLQSLAASTGLNPPGLQAVTLPSLSRLQFAGGAIAAASTVNSAGTVEMLGGASNVSITTGLNAGTYVRSPGGGILGLPGIQGNANYTATSVPLVSGIIPWAIGGNTGSQFITLSGTTLGLATSTLVNGNNINNMNSPTGNFTFPNTSSWTLTASNTANSILATSLLTGDLVTHTLTVNALIYNTTNVGIRADPGGALRIGSSGELVLHNQGAAVEISPPIIESAAGGWLTFGSASIYGGLRNGMVTLSGSNSHSGGTSVLSRRVSINNAYALGSGTFRIGGNAIVLDNTTAAPLTIATNNLHEWNSDFSFGGTQDLNLGTGTVSLGTWAGSIRTVTVNAGNLTVGGRIVDGTHADLPTTALAKDGPGTLILTGSNGYTGATESWGGELRFANRNALYGADTSKWVPANFTTGTLAVISVSVGDQPGAFTAADLDILDGAVGGPLGGYLGIDTTGVTSGTYIYASNIAAPAGDRVLGIAKTGAGTLMLTGNNAFTGGVLARQGRLLVTNANQVGPGTLVAAGGLLDMGGVTVSNTFSIISGTIANAAIDAAKFTAAVTGPAVFSGTLTGTSNWTKSGTGTLVLSAANTLTGTTTLAGGLLSISSDANLNGTASALVFNGGGLQVTGAALTSLASGRSTTFTTGTMVTFDIADPANSFAVTQNLQHGNAGLTKSGAGTLVAGGNNTFTGDVLVAGGTLR